MQRWWGSLGHHAQIDTWRSVAAAAACLRISKQGSGLGSVFWGPNITSFGYQQGTQP